MRTTRSLLDQEIEPAATPAGFRSSTTRVLRRGEHAIDGRERAPSGARAARLRGGALVRAWSTREHAGTRHDDDRGGEAQPARERRGAGGACGRSTSARARGRPSRAAVMTAARSDGGSSDPLRRPPWPPRRIPGARRRRGAGAAPSPSRSARQAGQPARCSRRATSAGSRRVGERGEARRLEEQVLDPLVRGGVIHGAHRSSRAKRSAVTPERSAVSLADPDVADAREIRAQLRERAPGSRLDRAERPLEPLGDLGLREVQRVAEDDDLALVLGQLGDARPDDRLRPAPLRDGPRRPWRRRRRAPVARPGATPRPGRRAVRCQRRPAMPRRGAAAGPPRAAGRSPGGGRSPAAT